MDIRYSYSAGGNESPRVDIYAPPGFEPPDDLTMTLNDREIRFLRLSDRSLECRDAYDIKGHCTSPDCHRMILGECQCGRHGSTDPNRPGIGIRVPFEPIGGRRL